MILTIRNGLIFIDMHSEDTSEGIFVGDVTNASTLSAAFDGVTWQRIAVAVGLGSQLPLKLSNFFCLEMTIETSKLREMQFLRTFPKRTVLSSSKLPVPPDVPRSLQVSKLAIAVGVHLGSSTIF